MTAQELARQADDAGLRLVRFLWCGNDGTVRAKASGRSGLVSRLERGIGVAAGIQAMNGLDQRQPVADMGAVGQYRLRPAFDTFRVLPYAEHTGAVLSDLALPDGEPAPVCQRGFLKRMEARLAEHGLTLRVGFENEFSLAKRAPDGAAGYEPVDRGLGFSTISLAASHAFADALVGALDKQRVPIEQYCAEIGHGQQEVSTGPAPALRAADEQILLRETIRGVAASKELVASLAPKPWIDQPGNGLHVHFSLWEGDRNRFHEAGGLSPVARGFLAGVVEHLPGLCGLTAPSFNSYRRIAPGAWAGAYRCWGPDNREAPVRVPSPFLGAEEETTNLELKACDASCNPYLALGGLIAAGLDGLERELEPPEPVDVDPGALSEHERARRRIEPLPATQAQALAALERDPVLTGALGEVLARSYVAVRRSEWAAYSAKDAAFEQLGHFEKY
ncbi:MAG TPA: glutamine synthetase family protein [Solirubrobacter sp.]|nr:glutamine synthetase family protein [Solirubrobacter sp.]